LDMRSPYFFKPITGYNPARLSIYQNLIDKYIFGRPNQNVLNMLNAKYIIFSNSQANQQQMQPNSSALGHCWLVKSVKLVEGPVVEIQAIGNINLIDTDVVQKTFVSAVEDPQWDSAA